MWPVLPKGESGWHFFMWGWIRVLGMVLHIVHTLIAGPHPCTTYISWANHRILNQCNGMIWCHNNCFCCLEFYPSRGEVFMLKCIDVLQQKCFQLLFFDCWKKKIWDSCQSYYRTMLQASARVFRAALCDGFLLETLERLASITTTVNNSVCRMARFKSIHSV